MMVEKRELYSVETFGMRWIYWRVTDDLNRLLHYDIIYAGSPHHSPTLDDIFDHMLKSKEAH